MDRSSMTFVLLMLAIVGGGLFLEYDHRRQQADSRPVEGVIEESDWTIDRDGTATLGIRYRYTVDGRQYTSHNVCPGVGDAQCYGHPKNVVPQYPEGTEVTVYVDPDDPSESFLINDDDLTDGVYLAAFGVVLGLVGLVGKLQSG